MSGAQKAGVVVLGLVGLYLLSGRAGDGSGGGFGGGGGADREPGDTTINFPELDLSQLWGDQDTKKTTYGDRVDYFQWLKSIGDLPTMGEEGDIMARSQFDISHYRTTTQALPVVSPIEAPKKEAYTHHGIRTLPDPVSLGLKPRRSSGGSKKSYIPSYVFRTPTPYKPLPRPEPIKDTKKRYYAGPGKTWGF